MEVKTEGLVLRATDYKENDKLLTLFSPTLGKITAGARGVKKPTAKLNFAAQPFAFCEYILANKGGRYTVTGAYLYDGFFDLRTDVVKYYAACTVAEILGTLVYGEGEYTALFVSAVEALKTLALGQADTAETLITFCLSALSESGYMIDLDGCGACGGAIGDEAYFDFSAGRFLCSECADGVRASRSTYETLRLCAGLTFAEGKQIGGGKRALRLIRAYLAEKTECEFPCFGELIRLYE